MSVLPPGATPPDLMLLLGRLDGKIDGIAGTLANMNTRADNHETRILSLETTAAVRSTYVARFETVETSVGELVSARDQGRGWMQAGSAIKVILGGAFAIIGYLGWQISVEPSPSAIQHKTVETMTYPVAK